MSIVNEAANIVPGSMQTVLQTIYEFLCEELRRYFIVNLPAGLLTNT